MKTFINKIEFYWIMVLKETLRNVVRTQQLGNSGIPRSLLKDIDLNAKHAIVISGIRRCGKSTLLLQIMGKIKKFYYFNFEDPRASGFVGEDFFRLDEVFKESGESDFYCFDEIQNVPEWEKFIRHLLDNKKKVVITGSNASMLGRELGTKLTGRHLSYELFPFSYDEFLALKSKGPSEQSFTEYYLLGGFPEYLESEDPNILRHLLMDVIERDIVARHELRNAITLKNLSTYLITNSAKEFSYNNLAKLFGVSVNTIISYISYLEDSYVLFTVSRLEYSLKKQITSRKKAYTIDPGFAKANSLSFSQDKGRIFENIAFLQLRRKSREIYYFRENYECDFIVDRNLAVQACYEVNSDNQDREINGIKEAMKQLKIKEGVILTYNQEDVVEGIKLVPLWKYGRD